MNATTAEREGSTASRLSGRALILLVTVITAALTLGLLINDLVRVLYLFEGAYDLEVLVGSPSGVSAGLDGDTELTQSYHWSVLVSSQEALQSARALQALSVGLTTLTFVAGAVTIMLLCRRLWTGRTFAPSAAVGLLVVSGLTLVTAWLAPWLRHRADEIALEALGYSTSGGTRWVELPYYDAWSADGAVLVLGVVLGLAGLVYLGSRRLQHDTEGLI
jgi:hypothetical protein